LPATRDGERSARRFPVERPGKRQPTRVRHVTTVCGICGRELENEDATAGHRHVEVASGEVTLTCMVCGESLGREEDLVRHQSQDHVGVDPPDEERAVP
jgi:hypothetical protein